MSRIGNSPIKVPEGVNINLQNKKIIVSGKLGSLEQDFKDVILHSKHTHYDSLFAFPSYRDTVIQ